MAVLIAVLIGLCLVSLAIRSHFVRKRKGPPHPVLDPFLNRNVLQRPAVNQAPIVPPACTPVEIEVLPGPAVVSGTRTPVEAPLPPAIAQLAERADLARFDSAVCIPGNAAGAESDRASQIASEPRTSAAFLKRGGGEAIAVTELACQQGLSLCASALAVESQHISTAESTASPATAFLARAPAPDRADPEPKELTATEEDSSPANWALDAMPVAVAEGMVPKEQGTVDGGGVPPTHPRDRLQREDGLHELHESAAAPEAALQLPANAATPQDLVQSEVIPTIAVYRAPVLAPRPITRSRSTRSTPAARVSQSSLEVRPQLMIGRAGDVHADFLFKRPGGFPASLTLKVRSKEIPLSAYGDEWYAAEVADPAFLADALRQGFIASERVTGNARTSWMLSAGREVYVTAPQSGLGGFHAVPRLALGRTQIVLVREHLQAEALELLTATCSKPVPRFAQDRAQMPGWAVFGPVLPLKSLAQVPGEEALNLLRPLPDLAILLEGGLCLRGTEWLEGFPPRITVAGSVPEGERVLIDAITASADSTEAYKTPGCFSAGDHTIWCSGISRSYSISPPPQLWESWQAHAHQRGSVCGALSNYQEVNPGAQLVTVPSSNTVLIGAEPGQVHAGTAQGGEWMGIVPFAPAWALPANPFQCRKNTVRIVLRASIPAKRGGANRYKAQVVKAWCRAILDCQRKGLTLESPSAAALWDGYVRAARASWRSVR